MHSLIRVIHGDSSRQCRATRAVNVGRYGPPPPRPREVLSMLLLILGNRSRKAKCLFAGIGEKCERCADRDLSCSFTNVNASVGSSPGAHGVGSSRARAYQEARAQRPLQPYLPSPVTASGSVYSLLDGHTDAVQGNYVIGGGTPGEILREAELSKDIMRLFFDHFSDINFLFDQASFLRSFDLGEIPQVILYPMLALGIRFSEAPCFDKTMPSHRGEALIKHGRNLLKNDFDHVSLHMIQAYILQCTYWLAFGAARKAWVYLGGCNEFLLWYLYCKMLTSHCV